jgi:hypothetical protein
LISIIDSAFKPAFPKTLFSKRRRTCPFLPGKIISSSTGIMHSYYQKNAIVLPVVWQEIIKKEVLNHGGRKTRPGKFLRRKR